MPPAPSNRSTPSQTNAPPSSAAGRQKAIQDLIERHPMHSRTEYLSNSRVNDGTQTLVSELSTLQELTQALTALQEDFERVKMTLRAQYETEINEKTMQIWKQIHAQLAALDAKNQQQVYASQQAYAVRYGNAINRLTGEFYRQRDALLLHIRKLRDLEREQHQRTVGDLQKALDKANQELHQKRQIITRYSMALRHYGTATEDLTQMEKESREYVRGMEEVLVQKDALIAEQKEKIAEYEAVLNPGGGKNGAAGSIGGGSPLRERRMSMVGGKLMGGAGKRRVSVVGGAASGASSGQSGVPAIGASGPINADANTKLFELGAKLPVVNPAEWAAKESMNRPIPQTTPPLGALPAVPESRGGISSSTVEEGDEDEESQTSTNRVDSSPAKNLIDEEILQKALAEMETSHEHEMQEVMDEYEGEILRLKLDMNKLAKQHQKQLANVQQSANVMASPDAMKVVLERQQNILKFAKLFFEKNGENPATVSKLGSTERIL